MGAIASALGRLGALLPERGERKTVIGQTVQVWEDGKPQQQRYVQNYWRFALEGYSSSEIVFSCIEELCTSAAEPRIRAMRKNAKGKPEALQDHPVEELFEHPNPFMSRFQLLAMHVMYLEVAGNAYLSLTRSAAGRVVEMWPIRPDRMFVIPDAKTYIRGWEYRPEGGEPLFVPAGDIIQTKTRNPLDDWYGLPPMAVCAPRIDTDAMMRSFTLAFFRNAGVPAGLLTTSKQMNEKERQVIRDRMRMETGGPQNWHNLMVLDNTEGATYQPMGMPLGQSGIILPELDEILEARIPMAFGVPLEVIGARLGMIHGNRSTMDAAVNHLWTGTLVPLYKHLADDFTRGLKPEYDGTPDEFDWLEYDLGTVQALQEDQDALHTRVRADVQAGIISVQEARAKIGHEPEYEKDALLILARGLEPMTAETALAGGPPDPATGAPAGAAQPGGQNGQNGHQTNGNGKRQMTPEDLAALKELAAGKGVG